MINKVVWYVLTLRMVGFGEC